MSEKRLEPMSIVRLKNLGVSFSKDIVLHDISLDLLSGQLVTLVGPNGAGKSTLLRVILGLLSPTQGTIERSAALRMGYVPQKFQVNPLLPFTVQHFLDITPQKSMTRKPHDCLKDVSALHLLNKSLRHLSGGELQRVLLAKALMREPDLLVLDEPNQGLDLDGQRLFYSLIQMIRDTRPKTTILLASHDLYMVLKTSDIVICLQKHICCMGHPDNVRYDPSYLKIFGQETPQGLVPYTHHHAHSHTES